MGGSNFDLIAQELLRHQDIMKELEAENRWLRQKLADLRAGQGIGLVINGKLIPLDLLQQASVPQVTQTLEQPEHLTTFAETPTIQHHEKSSAQVQDTTDPLPSEETQKVEQTTFLEEIMIDEFSAATGSSRAIWQGPVTKKETIKQPKPIDEDELAALRRDLMGSFLLE